LTLTTCPDWGSVLDEGTGLEGQSGREREIVIGTGESVPVGMCFMPLTDPKTVKNRVHLDLTMSLHKT